jgi:hypothetical protein
MERHADLPQRGEFGNTARTGQAGANNDPCLTDFPAASSARRMIAGLFAFFQKYFIKGLTAAAVNG